MGLPLFVRRARISILRTEAEDDCPYAQQNGALEVLGLESLLPPPCMSYKASQASQASQEQIGFIFYGDGSDGSDGF